MSPERSCARMTRSCSVPPTGQTSFLSSCFHGRWLEFLHSLSATFVRVKLASFLLWLAACQIPKPQPLVQRPHSSPPKIKPNSNSAPPPILRGAQTHKRKFPGPIRPRACPPATLSTDPHHHSHRHHHKPLLPPCTLLCLQSKGTGSSGEVKCSLQALSYAPLASFPPRLTSFLLELKAEVLQSAAENTRRPGREVGREELEDCSL